LVTAAAAITIAATIAVAIAAVIARRVWAATIAAATTITLLLGVRGAEEISE
jgi:hypothetical protein